MTIYTDWQDKDWKSLLKRPAIDTMVLEETVKPIFDDVRKNGDKAVRKYTAQYDKCDLENFRVAEQEIYFALNQIDTALFDAIKTAADIIAAFHRKQVQPIEKIETMPGVV